MAREVDARPAVHSRFDHAQSVTNYKHGGGSSVQRDVILKNFAAEAQPLGGGRNSKRVLQEQFQCGGAILQQHLHVLDGLPLPAHVNEAAATARASQRFPALLHNIWTRVQRRQHTRDSSLHKSGVKQGWSQAGARAHFEALKGRQRLLAKARSIIPVVEGCEDGIVA